MPENTAHFGRTRDRGPSFFAMFWDGLKPFPGRGRITLRLAIACTLIVLVTYTFRMPFQDLMPFFVLFITKEEKVTTVVTAILVLFAVTIAIAAALLIYKFTGERPEIRVPVIGLEIFVGMYLFRVFAIGAVGWIIGFVCAAAQSLVYLFPSPEETVHQFLWLWAAIALSTVVAWLANFLLFPISPTDLFQREFAGRWGAVSAAVERLSNNQPDAGLRLLRPLGESGPIRLLKLLKFSSMESPALGAEQTKLKGLILALDKMVRLMLTYAKLRVKAPSQPTIPSNEAAVLTALNGQAQSFQQQFEASHVPSGIVTLAQTPATDQVATPLLEAENTLRDVAAGHTEAKKAAPKHKPSLFVPDALSNPRHAQFALKVTLAGMIGYLFYTASDYYGIHTVFYTPLIIALSSAGATINKGFLRIVGCTIGGALGLVCTVWLLPRFQTLGTFLFIVFCVHGLAAWIAVGSEKISYIGLQIALAFDLGFLQGYGPPQKIDPLRDRFIGIVLGIVIVTIVFSLIWPESAELSAWERLAACLRSIARLLRTTQTSSRTPQDVPGSAVPKNADQQEAAEKELVPALELEIASHLSEAYSYQEQTAFETLLYGEGATQASPLKKAVAGVQEIYVSSLPWLREQATVAQTIEPMVDTETGQKARGDLDAAVEYCTSTVEALADRLKTANADSRLLGESGLEVPEHVSSETLSHLVRVIRELENDLDRTTSPAPIMQREGI